MINRWVIAFLVIFLGNSPKSVLAYDFESGGIYYHISGDNVSVTSGDSKYQGDIIIPNQVTYDGNAYNVTSIEDDAFLQCLSLTSINIPNSVTSIGDRAFYHCERLGTVVIPNSVKTIGNAAFTNCTSLSSVLIPNSVITIGNNAFDKCSSLSSIDIPNSVSSVGDFTFRGCTNLTSVLIPNSVTIIGTYAFSGCSFTSITIPNSVTSIGDCAFRRCYDLTFISISNSVTSIGGWAFEDCSGLASVTIPNSVTFIGQGAYKGCDNLNTIVSEISEPFYCNEIFSSNTYSNAELIVPKGTKALYQATEGWNQFTKITEAEGEEEVSEFSVDGIYYYTGMNNIVYVTSGEVKYSGDVVIPESVVYGGKIYSVTKIGPGAFEGCSGLTSITIPNSIKEIWDNAFEGCVNLTAVYISDLKAWLSIWYEESSPVPFYSSPLYYAGHLFLNGSEIKDLVIPNNITSIGHFGFLGCIGLTSVTIPNSVTSIGYYAFSYCNSLTTIVSEIENPFKIYDGNFSDDTYKNAELIVPKGTKVLYQATEGWNKFTKITEAEGEVEVSKFSVNSIYYKVGENNTVSVTSGELKYSGDVLIPEQVTYNGKTYSVISIEKYAFQGCSGLTSVTIGNNVTSIGSLAFDCCSGLTSIIIPNSVNSIGSEAFWDCTSLTTINIPNSVTRIGEDAFRGCNNLSSVHITDIAAWCNIYFDYAGFNQHANPLTIAPHLYLNGIEIKDMIIPKSVISISDFSFYGWSGLTSVTITNNVTTIGRMAFNGCNGLATIVLEKEEPFVINSDIFSDDTYTNAELIVPKGTKALYQATEGWNKFARITEAADKDESLFTIDGITYQGSKVEKNIVVKSVDTSRTWMEIPASVSYDGITYQVTGIDNDVFRGSSMAALIWDVEAVLPNNAFSNASIGSNFLLYVKSSSYAPSSVKNVVVNGMAQTIVLSDDGGQFYCPQTFTARSISYTHNYSMETDIGKAKGWETLALPFDVQKILHSTRGEIVPFPSYNSSSTQKPFWLANFSGSGFRRTAAVLANEPYIIAMPNSSSYRNEYNLAGDVTFSADNVQVPKTPSFSGTFVPAFGTVPQSSTVYALNVNNRHVKYSGNYDAGSRFIANLRDVRPFEAYMTGSSSTRGIIEISFDDGATDMLDILLPTDESQKVSIHTLSGQQIICTTQCDFDAVWQQLPKGVYIINGKKWIK